MCDICPYCKSSNTKRSNSNYDDLLCNDCNQEWDPEFLWIHDGMNLWMKNLYKKYDDLDEDKKFQIHIRLINSKNKWHSAKNIQDDPSSAMVLLMLALEDICEALALFLYDILPDAYKFSHEIKMRASYEYSPIDETGDEPYLCLNVSTTTSRSKRIDEPLFWKKEEGGLWKSPEERYATIFKDGRYFRSEKWLNFLKEDFNPELAQLCQYCTKFYLFLLERGLVPGYPILRMSKTDIQIFTKLKHLDEFVGQSELIREMKDKENRNIDG